MHRCKLHTRYAGKRPPIPTIKFPQGCPDCRGFYADTQLWDAVHDRKNVSGPMLAKAISLLTSELRRRKKIDRSNARNVSLQTQLEASLAKRMTDDMYGGTDD